MVDTLTFYQGDSSDTVATDVYAEGTLLTNLTGYTGTLSLVKCIGDDPLVVKDLTEVDGQLRAFFAPEDTANLTPGDYFAVLEVINETFYFRKEQHIPVSVLKQGYVA